MFAAENIHTSIRKLVCYGLENGLISAEDRIYAANSICTAIQVESALEYRL